MAQRDSDHASDDASVPGERHVAAEHEAEVVAGHGPAEHGDESEALGPVDLATWGAGAVGILLGLVVAAALAVSAGWIAVG